MKIFTIEKVFSEDKVIFNDLAIVETLVPEFEQEVNEFIQNELVPLARRLASARASIDGVLAPEKVELVQGERWEFSKIEAGDKSVKLYKVGSGPYYWAYARELEKKGVKLVYYFEAVETQEQLNEKLREFKMRLFCVVNDYFTNWESVEGCVGSYHS